MVAYAQTSYVFEHVALLSGVAAGYGYYPELDFFFGDHKHSVGTSHRYIPAPLARCAATPLVQVVTLPCLRAARPRAVLPGRYSAPRERASHRRRLRTWERERERKK